MQEKGNNPCFDDGHSQNCSIFIQKKHHLSDDELEMLRILVDGYASSGQLLVSDNNRYSPFDMGMACFAAGNYLPADDGCASCLHCTQQMSVEVCDLFCSEVSNAAWRIRYKPSTLII